MAIVIKDVIEHYMIALLWSEVDCDEDGSNGEPFDENFSPSDINAAGLLEIETDCTNFCTDERVIELVEKTGMTDEQLGHDFCLTRNRHGAGFWDRGYGPAGDELTKMAHAYGSCHLMNNGDGTLSVTN